MVSRTRRWRDTAVDQHAAESLASVLRIPLPTGKVLVARGYAAPDAARNFLNPRLSNLADPFDLPDLQRAVDRIWRALDDNERVVIFGDYDADGVTSTTVLTAVLRALGGDIRAFIPSRFGDGYGLTLDALKRCLELHQPNLLITVDCGTMAVESVGHARAVGVDVIVTDHHELSGPLAPALAVVNPKRHDDCELSILAGVGVAFKICHGLVKQGLRDERESAKAIDLRDWLDVVAVGTVADMVPLQGENRILVRHGLRHMNSSPGIGLRALIDNSGIKGSVDGYHLGFMLGPRLNAAGRLGSAERGLELLMAQDPQLAHDLATELGAANAMRKKIEDEIKEEAVIEIDRCFSRDTFGLVVGREGWHVGTIGIVASRLTARYYRPSIVIGIDEDGSGHGSCRSIEEIDLVEVLSECSDLLERFGGHKMAAGLSVSAENVGPLRERFNSLCAERLKGKELAPIVDVAAWVGLGEADDRLLESIHSMQPFGMGNPEPIWGVRSVQVVGQPRRVGKDHLKLIVASGGTQMEAVAFGMADCPLPDGGLDMLFSLRENVFRGRRTLQLYVKDWRAAVA